MASEEKPAVPDWDAADGLEISVAQVAEARDKSQSFRLIDCREDDEYAICRIDGSELLPLGHFGELAEVRLPDRDEPIAVY